MICRADGDVSNRTYKLCLVLALMIHDRLPQRRCKFTLPIIQRSYAELPILPNGRGAQKFLKIFAPPAKIMMPYAGLNLRFFDISRL
ncbi:protein of unknown function [Magnetospirillum sp. XM-1]|nr:protein of unknown function [Magnetospirillum sp. XM-1]